MSVYTFREGYPLAWAMDPQEVGEYIERLHKKYEGVLTAEQVVEDTAVNPKSPLKNYFEWDDTEAARKWRIQQAQVVLAAVAVVEPEIHPTRPTRAFVSVVKGDHNYRMIGTVLNDSEMRQAMLKRATRELENLRRRYQDLTELRDVFEAIEQLQAAS
jgi:hypothetical protein